MAHRFEHDHRAALLLGTPFFILFGAWSDRIGRKPIMLAGMNLAVLTYYPIYGSQVSVSLSARCSSPKLGT